MDIDTIFIVALPAEAKPINRHFGLQRDNHYGELPLYSKDKMALIITGCGGQAASRAAIWMESNLNHGERPAWINLGIAGHATMEIGQVVLAESIEDAATGTVWLPALPPSPPCATESVITLQQPDLSYSHDGVVDMEAAALLRPGSDIIDPERFYCLKVISDNQQHPASEINGKMVSGLIEDSLGQLLVLLQQIEIEE
jgi:nucleoside phosphorylase